jgi:hypothetical protein
MIEYEKFSLFLILFPMLIFVSDAVRLHARRTGLDFRPQ